MIVECEACGWAFKTEDPQRSCCSSKCEGDVYGTIVCQYPEEEG